MSTPEQLAQLRELYDGLERHDWFYAMSDDHGVYCAGQAVERRLRDVASGLPGGLELMNGMMRHTFSGESFSTPKAPKPPRP